MLFRWSIWGKRKETYFKLLRHSIATFRRFFGNHANYIIFTDDKAVLSSTFNSLAEIADYSDFPNPLFLQFEGPTWAKWSPSPRYAPGETEILVDCDVFLLDEPHELIEFCKAGSKYKYLVLQEFKGAAWQRGKMGGRVKAGMPFINAGFFAQHATADLTADILAQYEWWAANVPASEASFHDEQGALTAALSRYQDELYLLPRERYRIISPRSNPELEDWSGTTMIHCTYPDHPAFDRFFHKIAAVSGQS